MRQNRYTKSLAIFLNLTLVGSTFADMGAPGAAASSAAMPDFVKALTPPEQLGFVTDSFKGNTDKPVILIQDLHANYGVQKKIEAILKYLQPIVTQGGHAMVMGIEGAWGNVDLTPLRNQDAKVKQVAGDFLMKEAEITGMDQFAITSEAPVKMIGIDDPEDYMLHRELVRKSLLTRLALAQKIERLRAAVASNKSDAPSALRHLWRVEDSFHAGKIDLPQLSKELDVEPLQNYGQAEAALAQRKEELADKQRQSGGVYMSNLVRADEDLQLLSRLLRQQLTLEEVQFVSSKEQEMLVAIQALIPGENMDQWKEAIRSAIEYYAIALMRDKPLSQNALKLSQANTDTSVVIVTGGFHTAGIAELLKQKQVSYMIVAPAVESHTEYDEALYIKRIMGIHLTQADILNKGLDAAVKQSVHALTQPPAAEALGPVETMGAVPNPEDIAGHIQHAEAIDGAFAAAAAGAGGAGKPPIVVPPGTEIPADVENGFEKKADMADEASHQIPAPASPDNLTAIVHRVEKAVGVQAEGVPPVSDTTPAAPTLAQRAASLPVVGPVIAKVFGSASHGTPSQQAHQAEAVQHLTKAEEDDKAGLDNDAAGEAASCSFCAFNAGPKMMPNGEANGGAGGGGTTIGGTLDDIAAAAAKKAEAEVAQGTPEPVAAHHAAQAVTEELKITPPTRPTGAEVSASAMQEDAAETAAEMREAAPAHPGQIEQAVIAQVANAVANVGAMGPQSVAEAAGVTASVALPETTRPASSLPQGPDIGAVAAGREGLLPVTATSSGVIGSLFGLIRSHEERAAMQEREKQAKLTLRERLAA